MDEKQILFHTVLLTGDTCSEAEIISEVENALNYRRRLYSNSRLIHVFSNKIFEIEPKITEIPITIIEPSHIPENYVNLTHIHFTGKWDELPELPPNLIYLNCEGLGLKTIPKLPNTLKQLHCNYNNISELTLPPELVVLHCVNEQLKQLPTLSREIKVLSIHRKNYADVPFFFFHSYDITRYDGFDDIIFRKKCNLDFKCQIPLSTTSCSSGAYLYES